MQTGAGRRGLQAMQAMPPGRSLLPNARTWQMHGLERGLRLAPRRQMFKMA